MVFSCDQKNLNPVWYFKSLLKMMISRKELSEFFNDKKTYSRFQKDIISWFSNSDITTRKYSVIKNCLRLLAQSKHPCFLFNPSCLHLILESKSKNVEEMKRAIIGSLHISLITEVLSIRNNHVTLHTRLYRLHYHIDEKKV